MRKLAMLLAVIIVLFSPVTAYASTMRSIGIVPRLTFSGTTANCSVIVTADSSEDEIVATIKLWKGSTCLETWHENGKGYLIFKDDISVTSGVIYELTAEVTINGIKQPKTSVSEQCK